MKVGKRDQKKIDKELTAFFAILTLSKNGVMMYDAFQEYLGKRNMQIVVNK